MLLIENTVKGFIDEVDSKSPAPGGGSVSALASSLGVALSKMVAHVTIGRKKYLELDESIRQSYEQDFNNLNDLKNQLIPLIDKDTEAFNVIMDVLKMPKETDDDKKKRSEAMEVATLGAIKVPFEVATLSLDALKVSKRMLEYGNKNAVSDIGVGALLLYTGLEGAILNVKINLSGLSNELVKNDYYNKSMTMLSSGKEIKDEILTLVHQKI